MSDSAPVPRALRLAEAVSASLALLAAGLVLRPVILAISARLDFPGDLEWMEGATLLTAERLRDGLPIYGAPGPDYIPFIYPPLYAAILSVLSHIWPLGYPLGRAVSVVAIMVAAGALPFAARKENASWPLALSSIGLLAATWDNAGTFFDLVRTDSLSLALIGWALVLGCGPTRRESVASGVLLALAFTAKQHAALLGIPIGLWTWRTYGWKRAAAFAAASAGPALVYSGVMIAVTHGAYFTWIATVATEHGIVAKRFFPGAQKECWEALPLTTTLLALVPFWLWRRSYWAANFVVILGIVSLMRGHTGGYLNVLMPMLWLQALLPFVAGSAAGEFFSGRSWFSKYGPNAAGAVARVVTGAAIALQLLNVQFPFSTIRAKLERDADLVDAVRLSAETYKKQIPSRGDREAVAALVGEIATLPEPILIPHAPWYAHMAGKQGSFSLITLWDIDHDHGKFARDVKRLDRQIAQGYFKSAVLPDDKLGHGLKDHFEKSASLKTRVSGPKTGWSVKLRHVWLYVPTEPGQAHSTTK